MHMTFNDSLGSLPLASLLKPLRNGLKRIRHETEKDNIICPLTKSRLLLTQSAVRFLCGKRQLKKGANSSLHKIRRWYPLKHVWGKPWKFEFCQTPTPGETWELTLLARGNKKKNKNDPPPRRDYARVLKFWYGAISCQIVWNGKYLINKF